MQQARWGVMTHYLADWIAGTLKVEMSVERWNQLVDAFDVEALADQLQSVGAAYHILTIGQNSGYYLAPNAVYDEITGVRPSRLSRRDLVADLAAALQKRGIRLIVYLPSGAPAGDAAARTALEWQNGPHPNTAFQRKWERIIRVWSERWGRAVAGWWFDGAYFPNAMYRSPEAPNFASFAAAARAGNPDAALGFNPGVVYRQLSVTPEEDFVGGEVDQPERVTIRRTVDGQVDGAQVHMLSYLGQTWGRGEPRFAAEQVVSFSRTLWDARGAVTWDVPVTPDGRIPQPFLDRLRAVGQAAAGSGAKP
jgi:hypothetical protein